MFRSHRGHQCGGDQCRGVFVVVGHQCGCVGVWLGTLKRAANWLVGVQRSPEKGRWLAYVGVALVDLWDVPTVSNLLVNTNFELKYVT